ncbi:MAG: phosphomethylpyrimidine synthase ThiC [Muribaculaceae bacterium]|nr:phosphomethylpyrimidine synthase ThiC [Muribaculaceae bacterium]
MKTIELNGEKESILVGEGQPIIINCNFGINNLAELDIEKDKIKRLFNCSETAPNTIMDLSLLNGLFPIAEFVRNNYGIPIGIVPIYGLNINFDSKDLIDQIHSQAKNKISFMTMHITADLDLYEMAIRTRKIPVTSRGGKIILNNTLQHNQRLNVYRRNIDTIIELSNFYGFAISLGTTFRPAGICDACDEVHIKETIRQIELAQYLTSKGCKVIIENVGHIGLDKLPSHCALLRQADVPIMPLGPVVLDSSIGSDHISASIGAAMMGYFDALNIINVITPAEHLHSKFTYDDVAEGIKAAKIAARSVNYTKFSEYAMSEHDIYTQRSKKRDCIIGNTRECTRCDTNCPLK